MKAVFIDANPTLAAVARRLHQPGDPELVINAQPDITPPQIPAVLGDAQIAIIDHTHLPVDIARACKGLKHVVFLGTGARAPIWIRKPWPNWASRCTSSRVTAIRRSPNALLP
ncbi:hypothetical protein [Bordetella trematum]|uniref:hypothetical protein n=1 Tax=Bordetella trematum TaxID=123899 RepID=UPI001E5871AA|nr:hypothetical protein [Bordetella trematum]